MFIHQSEPAQVRPIVWKGGEKAETAPKPTCFLCEDVIPGRGDGRFCNAKCREAYDHGFVYRKPEPIKYRWEISPDRMGELMPVMGGGFAIQCFGCRKTFSSKGLRCCSATCERSYVSRQESKAIMESAGMERLYVHRKCQVCPGEIPRWTGVGKKRRAVPITQVTCSRKCRKKLRMAPSAKTAISVVERP